MTPGQGGTPPEHGAGSATARADGDAAGPELAVRGIRALGTTAIVAVVDPTHADRAEMMLRHELAAVDRTCSRFRADSELSALHRAGGRPVVVSRLLFDAIEVAYRVAERTGGAVDPTVGAALEALGYDRDLDEVTADGPEREDIPEPAPGWWTIELDSRTRTIRLPALTKIDLGATAKALVADRSARRIAGILDGGVLVSVGGDVATAGRAPAGGWAIGIAVDSSRSTDDVAQVVTIERGGLASSSTAVRTWRRGERRLHHIVDPRTGDEPPYWTLVSASAASCVEANAITTAAVVWGAEALPRVAVSAHPARLVRYDGRVIVMNGWPEDRRPSVDRPGAGERSGADERPCAVDRSGAGDRAGADERVGADLATPARR